MSADELLAGPAAMARRLLLPEAGEEPALDASFAVVHGLYWLAANLAERRPLVIVVDDVHWSDAPSMRWLAYLASRVEGLPLVLLTAMRPSDPVSEGASMARLRASATPLRPRLLSDAAVAGIVREAWGDDGTDEACAHLATASGGNPFYLAELLRAGVVTELVASADDGILRHVLSRVRRLERDAAGARSSPRHPGWRLPAEVGRGGGRAGHAQRRACGGRVGAR